MCYYKPYLYLCDASRHMMSSSLLRQNSDDVIMRCWILECMSVVISIIPCRLDSSGLLQIAESHPPVVWEWSWTPHRRFLQQKRAGQKVWQFCRQRATHPLCIGTGDLLQWIRWCHWLYISRRITGLWPRQRKLSWRVLLYRCVQYNWLGFVPRVCKLFWSMWSRFLCHWRNILLLCWPTTHFQPPGDGIHWASCCVFI